MPDDQSSNTIEPEHIVSADVKDIAIQSIPEKFYGAALSARISEVKKTKESPTKPGDGKDAPKKRHRSMAPVIAVVVLLLAGVGGGFVYFNRDLLFKPSTPVQTPTPVVKTEPPKPAPPPPPPSAPTDLSATATSPTVVQLNWTDTSNNEAGFRVERRESASAYAPLTSLPPNSTAFQDSSASPSTSYLYRMIAMNEGGDSPASNEVSITTPAPPPAPPEPAKLPPAGLDSDSDGLTDLEEPLYGGDPRNPDTDHDTFLDGNEVFHLYNPASGKNAKLLESNLVKVFESKVGWRILVPITWKTELSDDGMAGTVSTGHGETFTMTLEPNPKKEKIMDWYLEQHPGTVSSQVTLKTTKSGVDGLVGLDPLTTYFPWGDQVLVFAYHLDDQPFVNYRTTYEMMQNALSLSVAPRVSASVTTPAVPPVSPSVPSSSPEPGATTPVIPSTPAVPTSTIPTPTPVPIPTVPAVPVLSTPVTPPPVPTVPTPTAATSPAVPIVPAAPAASSTPG